MKRKKKLLIKRIIALSVIAVMTGSITASADGWRVGNIKPSDGSDFWVGNYTFLSPALAGTKLVLEDPKLAEKNWVEYVEYALFTEVQEGDTKYYIYQPTDYATSSIMAIRDYNPDIVSGSSTNLSVSLGDLATLFETASLGNGISEKLLGGSIKQDTIAKELTTTQDVVKNSKYYATPGFMGIPGDSEYTGVSNNGYFNASSMSISMTKSSSVQVTKTLTTNSTMTVGSSESKSATLSNTAQSSSTRTVSDTTSNTRGSSNTSGSSHTGSSSSTNSTSNTIGTSITESSSKTQSHSDSTSRSTTTGKSSTHTDSHTDGQSGSDSSAKTNGKTSENSTTAEISVGFEGIGSKLGNSWKNSSTSSSTNTHTEGWNNSDTSSDSETKSNSETKGNTSTDSNSSTTGSSSTNSNSNTTGSSTTTGSSNTASNSNTTSVSDSITNAITNANSTSNSSSDSSTGQQSINASTSIGYGLNYATSQQTSVSETVSRTFSARDDEEVKNVGWKLCEYIVRVPYYIEAVKVDNGEETLMYSQYVTYDLLKGVSRVFANGYIEHWNTGELVTYADFFEGFITAQELVDKAKEQAAK